MKFARIVSVNRTDRGTQFTEFYWYATNRLDVTICNVTFRGITEREWIHIMREW